MRKRKVNSHVFDHLPLAPMYHFGSPQCIKRFTLTCIANSCEFGSSHGHNNFWFILTRRTRISDCVTSAFLSSPSKCLCFKRFILAFAEKPVYDVPIFMFSARFILARAEKPGYKVMPTSVHWVHPRARKKHPH